MGDQVVMLGAARWAGRFVSMIADVPDCLWRLLGGDDELVRLFAVDR